MGCVSQGSPEKQDQEGVCVPLSVSIYLSREVYRKGLARDGGTLTSSETGGWAGRLETQRRVAVGVLRLSAGRTSSQSFSMKAFN